jgi:transcriptional regulator with XRE-family HTH domain
VNVRVATLFAAVDLRRLGLRSVFVLDETVHERVKRLRERKNLSQADIEKATDGVVKESWLSKFESAHRPKYPTREQLEPLAGPLGVDLAYLLAPMRIAPIEVLQSGESPTLDGWALRVRGDPDLTDRSRDVLEDAARNLQELYDELKSRGKER